MDEATKNVVDGLRKGVDKLPADMVVGVTAGHLRTVLDALDEAHNEATVLEVPSR